MYLHELNNPFPVHIIHTHIAQKYTAGNKLSLELSLITGILCYDTYMYFIYNEFIYYCLVSKYTCCVVTQLKECTVIFFQYLIHSENEHKIELTVSERFVSSFVDFMWQLNVITVQDKTNWTAPARGNPSVLHLSEELISFVLFSSQRERWARVCEKLHVCLYVIQCRSNIDVTSGQCLRQKVFDERKSTQPRRREQYQLWEYSHSLVFVSDKRLLKYYATVHTVFRIDCIPIYTH